MRQQTIYQALPDPPTTPDRGAAREVHTAVLMALEGDWSHQERSSLLRLEKRWRLRWKGRDARWNVAGTRAGRLPRETEAAITQWYDEQETPS